MEEPEAHTRQSLVLRGHRRGQLTPAGEIFLQTVVRALDELDNGVAKNEQSAGARRCVRILAMPSFASRWLIPRLHELSLNGIDVDIELTTSMWDADCTTS